MHCFVIFELKIGDFKPEFAGKLNFYVNTVNEQLKGIDDKPTIGVLLCKTPNETVIKYSLKGIDTPIGVADYQLAQALPKELKGEIPSIEELEAELEKEVEKLHRPVDKKLNHLKTLIGNLGNDEITIRWSMPVQEELTQKVLLPFTKILNRELTEIKKLFTSFQCDMSFDGYGRSITADSLKEQLLMMVKEQTTTFSKWNIRFRFEGFKQGGLHAFDSWMDVVVNFSPYKYSFIAQNNQVLLEKLYHQTCTETEMMGVAEKYTETLLEQITDQVENLKKTGKI